MRALISPNPLQELEVKAILSQQITDGIKFNSKTTYARMKNKRSSAGEGGDQNYAGLQAPSLTWRPVPRATTKSQSLYTGTVFPWECDKS